MRGGERARAYELEPREVDLIVEALTIYRDRRAEYLPGMRQKEEASPTQNHTGRGQRCSAALRRADFAAAGLADARECRTRGLGTSTVHACVSDAGDEHS
jgi:hypothetical protein